jgi:AcrR family transcriptional regulator
LSLPLPAAERSDAARNRKKILEAARRLMGTRGLDAVCMDELAAAAGVGKGTLYRRFTDKTALFRALLDDDERALQERVRARFGLPRAAPPALRLAALWSALVDFVIDHADVLAAAEVEARSRAALAEQAPYHWRHRELVRALEACGVDGVRGSLLADAWLNALAADVVRRALARAPTDVVRAAWRSLPGGIDGPVVG